MAFTEQRVLKSVTVDIVSSTAEVLWVDEILRDGEIITTTNHRRAYTIEEKDQFLADVDGSSNYLIPLQW